MKAFLAIQCRTDRGVPGDFLYTGDRAPVSPVFDNLASLFAWCRSNGWKEGDYDAEHPCGVYNK